MTNQNQNQVATPAYSTALTKISNTFFPMIEQQLTGNGLDMDHYAKQCVMSAISSINEVLDTKGVSWQDAQLDKSNVTQTLLTVAALKLNAAANPREVYFQIRNVNRKKAGKDNWIKQVEMGIEGDGNDAILARFGRDIEQVRQYWLVKENDDFEYPSFNGLEMTPPKWTPKGSGKVVKVVYPIIKTGDVVEYQIAEREDVIYNLIAHVNNNLMNETFGIAKDRYNATPKQKEEISAKKKEILDKVKELGLDAALDDEELQKHISPAWKDPHSREQMIIRKMRNNIVKKIPKDFGNAFVEMTYSDAEDESLKRHRREVNENANQELIDVTYDEPEPTPEAADETEDKSDQEPVIIEMEPTKETTDEPQSEKQPDLFETAASGPAW